MISLAIDTASHLCAVALHDSQRDLILAERSESIGRGHAERLMDMVADVLAAADADYSRLSRVVATVGPGSFTGIRVGLATARGIALGLSIPAVGVSSLEAIAESAAASGAWDRSAPLFVAVDARRGEAWCRFAGSAAPRGAPAGDFVSPYHRIAEWAGFPGLNLCGSGSVHVNEAAGANLPVLGLADAPPIAAVARLGARLDPASALPEPAYIRPPDARPQAGFALKRA